MCGGTVGWLSKASIWFRVEQPSIQGFGIWLDGAISNDDSRRILYWLGFEGEQLHTKVYQKDLPSLWMWTSGDKERKRGLWAAGRADRPSTNWFPDSRIYRRNRHTQRLERYTADSATVETARLELTGSTQGPFKFQDFLSPLSLPVPPI